SSSTLRVSVARTTELIPMRPRSERASVELSLDCMELLLLSVGPKFIPLILFSDKSVALAGISFPAPYHALSDGYGYPPHSGSARQSPEPAGRPWHTPAVAPPPRWCFGSPHQRYGSPSA